MKIAKTIAIVAVVMSLLLVFCVGIAQWHLIDLPSPLNCTSDLFGFIGALMAIANALFLYATLSYQGRSFRQERFETTFFNLLENHRKLVKSISFKVETLDSLYNNKSIIIDDNNLFSFALNEVCFLKRLLQKQDYPILSYWDFQGDIASVENKHDGLNDIISIEDWKREKEAVIEEYELSRRALLYNIDNDKWNDIKLKIEKEKCKLEKAAYTIFYQKRERHFAPYFKSLSLIFMHISDEKSIGRKKKAIYKKYVVDQMTQDEQDVIKLHCLYDDSFYEQIKRLKVREPLSQLVCSCTKDALGIIKSLIGFLNCQKDA